MHCLDCDAESDPGSTICSGCGRPIPSDPDRYFKAGMAAMATDDHERAAMLLEDCLELSPGHINGRYNLGMALSLGGRYEEAMAEYLAVVEQDAGYPGIYTALGQVAFGSYMDHIERAEIQRKAMVFLLKRAIEQDSDDVDAYFSLANAYIAIDSADKALPCLKRALRLHPDSSAILFTMAKALKMLGKYEEATIMAARALHLSEKDDPFREDIRDLLAELRQTPLPM